LRTFHIPVTAKEKKEGRVFGKGAVPSRKEIKTMTTIPVQKQAPPTVRQKKKKTTDQNGPKLRKGQGAASAMGRTAVSLG